MKKKLLLLTAAISIFIFIQPKSQTINNDAGYYKLFKKAEVLFNGEATAETDSTALSYYSLIAAGVAASQENASLLYNCHERIGILKQGLAYNSKDVLAEYYTSLQIHRNYHLPDSILFRLLLAAGNQHYTDGLFDSALYYFSWAERLIGKYPASGYAEDLYNSLGALYTESGDYRQSGNYFNKALEITKKTRPDMGEAIFAMSLNVASALRLSGHLDSAVGLYKKLLQPGVPLTPLLNNLGRIYLSKKMPDSALYYLQQVKEVSGNYAIAYNNSLALAYMQKGDTVMTAKYLNTATNIFKTNTEKIKNNYYGSACKYIADLKLMEGQAEQALRYYQQAIIQYDFKFNEEDVFINPADFIGEFASYDLFEALLAKANCFAALYAKNAKGEYFTAAKNTYETAFTLADYIKKSIDNDEARLFIADKVFKGYHNAIDFILADEARKKDEALILLALKWISKSTATSLAISLKENTIKQYAGLPDSLLQKEKNIKINLVRLQLQLHQVTDTGNQQAILSMINTSELQLQQLINTYKQFPPYYKQKFASDSIDIDGIQKNILDTRTAIICYYGGEKGMNAFVIKQSSVACISLLNDSMFHYQIGEFINGLVKNNTGQTDNENASSLYLYKTLMQPLEKQLDDISSLIIIPDEQLINLPFEAMLMPDNHYLVEKYAITYQYALPFLQLNSTKGNIDNALAFAPFGGNNQKSIFSTLHSSIDEISSFAKTNQLINENATKDNFVNRVASASVIHLATHAVADYDEPANSYIAFYPIEKADTSYKLFASELYNMQLPHTQLVFLSACETGSGKLSQSEGALSLSRAFAYAGCANIVTSLWKAEDRSTAYISEKFYHYLGKGYTYAQALQQAKKDLLKDTAMSQFHAPQYWSHLIFIGDVQQQQSYTSIWIIVVTLLIALSTFYFIMKRRKAAM